MAISDTPFDPTALREFMKAVSPILSNQNFARDYLTGNFEPELPEIHVNEKTVFANPMAIKVTIGDLMRESGKDAAQYALRDAHKKLLRSVANETRCSECSRLDVMVEQQANPITMSTDYNLRTVCKLAQKGMTSLVCPDGSLTSINTSGLDRSRVSFRPPPMVYMPAEDYRPADQPTTKSDDTAW